MIDRDDIPGAIILFILACAVGFLIVTLAQVR